MPSTADSTKPAPEPKQLPVLILCLMSAVTFMAVLSELAPSGVLPQMAEGLGSSLNSTGNLVGIYAFAAAVFSIPMVKLTLRFDRKKVLMALLAGFAAANLMIFLSHNFWLTGACRIIGGICAGTMWPMIGAYGLRLVPSSLHGRAVVIIFGGTTLSTSAGMPLLTLLGRFAGWRAEFLAISLILIALLLLAWRFLPSVPGSEPHEHPPIAAIFKNHYVFSSLVLTLLSVTGLYSVYIYITLVIQEHQFWGGVESALALFGVGAMSSIVTAGKLLDRHFQRLLSTLLGIGALSMLIMLSLGRFPYVSPMSFVLFGFSYGVLTTYQAIISKHLKRGQDVAISLQVVTFNVAIMLASSLGGWLTQSVSLHAMISAAMILLLLACLLVRIDRRTYAIGPNHRPSTDP